MRPYFFKEGILYCYVDSPVWNQQYSLLKKEIIEKLNDGYDKKKIVDIRFKVGSFDQIHYIIRGETDKIKKSINKVRLSDTENTFISECLKDINPDLQDNLEEYLIYLFKIQKYKGFNKNAQQ